MKGFIFHYSDVQFIQILQLLGSDGIQKYCTKIYQTVKDEFISKRGSHCDSFDNLDLFSYAPQKTNPGFNICGRNTLITSQLHPHFTKGTLTVATPGIVLNLPGLKLPNNLLCITQEHRQKKKGTFSLNSSWFQFKVKAAVELGIMERCCGPWQFSKFYHLNRYKNPLWPISLLHSLQSLHTLMPLSHDPSIRSVDRSLGLKAHLQRELGIDGEVVKAICGSGWY